MLLVELATASAAVAAAPGRNAKVDLLAAVLRAADADEVALAAGYLAGDLRQRRTGLGWAALRDLPAPATEATLQLREVDQAFARIAEVSGAGSVAARASLVAGLFGRATAAEQRLLAALVGGELRQGAQAGLMADAVARAAGVPTADVRRALMLCGSLPEVAQAARAGALDGFRLQVGRPLAPMLAQPGSDLADALARAAPAAVEWKLDGIRVQVHRDGDEVGVWTRTLDDITTRVPELVAVARELPCRQAVLDGEAIALRVDGRPQPFQVTAGRAAQRGASPVPLTPFFFDLLHVDGRDLLDEPQSERAAALDALVPERYRAPRLVTDDLAAAQAFADDALARGHEGVVVKSLAVPYEAGRRGAGWLKVKPRHTLDLVVLAVEWGHGRRSGWLSNLHLGARDPAGGWVMLGKTFKGLSDELLRWQTERFLELEESRNDWQVFVRPEQVVEVAFDGVQRSSRYPGGVALRFARVLRYRDDKSAAEADTIDDVRRLAP